MSGSGPQSSASQSSPVQSTVQGGSGTTNTTSLGSVSGNATFNDPALQLATVQALADSVKSALTGAGAISTQTLQILADSAANQAQLGASGQSSDAQILSDALASQQFLANAQGTGGASLTYASDKSSLWAVVAIAAAAIFGIFFMRKGHQ